MKNTYLSKLLSINCYFKGFQSRSIIPFSYRLLRILVSFSHLSISSSFSYNSFLRHSISLYSSGICSRMSSFSIVTFFCSSLSFFSWFLWRRKWLLLLQTNTSEVRWIRTWNHLRRLEDSREIGCNIYRKNSFVQ